MHLRINKMTTVCRQYLILLNRFLLLFFLFLSLRTEIPLSVLFREHIFGKQRIVSNYEKVVTDPGKLVE